MSDRLEELARDSAVGGFSLFLGEAYSTIVLAVGLILIARLLGPDGYGLYTLAFVVPLISVNLIEFDLTLFHVMAQSNLGFCTLSLLRRISPVVLTCSRFFIILPAEEIWLNLC
jgi:hypothetical protein